MAEVFARLGFAEDAEIDEQFFYSPIKPSVSLTPEEKAWLAAHPEIRLGIDANYPPFEYIGQRGDYLGMAADYLDLINKRLATDMKFVPGLSWSEVLERAKQGEIDALPTVAKTQARSTYLNFSRPYMTFPMVFLTRKDQEPVDEFANLAGSRLAMVKNYFYVEEIQRKHPDIEPVFVESPLEALNALATGRVDAAITNFAVANHLILKHALVTIRQDSVADISSKGFGYGVRKDWPELVTILNKAIDSIDEVQHAEIRKRWLTYLSFPQEKEISKVELSPEERAWLKDHKVIRVTSEPDYAPFDFQIDGKPAGYSVDYVKLLAERLGISLEFVKDSWSNLLKKAENKEVDLVHSIFKAPPEREEYLNFTKHYKRVLNGIVIRDGVSGINSLDDLTSRTVGLVRGDSVAQLIPELVPDARYVYFDDYIPLLKAVSLGKADATVLELPVANYVIRQLSLTNLKIAAEMTELGSRDQRYRLAVRKDWPVFVSILEKTMDSLQPEELLRIENKWMTLPDVSDDLSPIALTDEERTWLRAHSSIRLGDGFNFAPFSYKDENEKFVGIASGYTQFLTEKLGIEFVPQFGLSWAQAIDGIKSGDIDVMPAITPSPEREAFMAFTEPYMTYPIVIAARKDSPFIDSLSDLSGKTLAIVEGQLTEKWISDDFPDIQLVPVKTTNHGLKAVADNRVSAFANNLHVISHEMHRIGLNADLSIVAHTPYTGSLAFGVRKDWQELVPILDKAFATMTDQEKAAIKNSWMGVTVQFGTQLSTILMWVVPAFLIILAFFTFVAVSNRKLEREVAERKEAEAQIIQSENRLKAATDGGNLGLWEYSHQTGELFANDKLPEMLGYAHDEILETNDSWAPVRGGIQGWTKYVHPDDIDRVVQAEQLYIEQKSQHYYTEYRVKCADTSWKWIMSSGRVIERDADGNPLRSNGILADINELKKLQNELEEAKDNAENATRAKSAFLANMSHELRTPLNAILGFSSLLGSDNALRKDQQDQLDTINRAGDQLLLLINDILDMSKIEAGRMVLEPADFDFWGMVDDVCTMLRVRAESSGLQLLLERSKNVPSAIHGDEMKIRQVLINLLSNAVKFTREGKVVLRLDTSVEPSGTLLIKGEVEDTGKGIAESDLERIFQPFEQMVDTAEHKGTGLGLAITRQFIELMSGSIHVTSTLGAGSCFHFEIRAEQPKEDVDYRQVTSKRKTVIGLKPDQPQWRVLVAEDNPENQQLLMQQLQAVGFSVQVANNGQEAIEVFKTWQPHFIWMDRRMPVMDGLEATRQIRTLPRGNKVIIAALTASVFKEQRDQVMEAGSDDFVRKPYRPWEIFDCMAHHLGLDYIYQDESASSEADLSPLTSEMLMTLPATLREELQEAADLMSYEQAINIVESIRSAEPEMAEALRKLLDNFDYHALQNLFQEDKPDE
ncbi:MAG: transporter substrate-binding domain-containing protein [Sedimenticola sp.]